MNANDPLFELTERLCNILRTETREAARRHGLLPVHLETLRYLANCNRFSDNPAAVTSYLGQTKGTVSQTIKLLESKGLVARRGDPDDRRRVHLRLTAKGRRVLAAALPPARLVTAGQALGEKRYAGLVEHLCDLLGELKTMNGYRSFGVCVTCSHHRLEQRGTRHCDLFEVRLSETDAGRVCVEHAPEEGGAEGAAA